MNRIAFLLLTFAAAVGPAFCATSTRPGAQTRTEIAIDGVWAGVTVSAEGGDPRDEVIVERPVGTAPLKKHVGNVFYAPIVLEMDPPFAPVLQTWISDFCANKQTRKTLLLTQYELGSQSAAVSVEALNTLLSEVRFPALDAASKEAAHLTLVFTPESTRAGGTPPAAPVATAKRALQSNFRFQLAGLTTTKISGIEAFTIKQATAATAVGELRDYTKVPGALDIPNLVLSITGVVTDWTAWRNDFIVLGNNTDSAEKTGSIELLSADLQTTLFALQLSHVGLVRVTPSPSGSSDRSGVVVAEIYIESMSAAPGSATTKNLTTKPGVAQKATDANAGGGAAGAAAAASVNDTKTAGAATDSSKKTDEAAAGAAQNDSKGDAATNGGAGSAAADRKDESLAAGGAAGAAQDGKTAAAGGAAASGKSSVDEAATATVPTLAKNTKMPGDLGAHDITDFPRPDGATRKSYSIFRSSNSIQENAAYASKSSLDDITAFYAKSLEAAGWTETSRMENNNAAGNLPQVVMNWTKPSRTAGIVIGQVKDGVEIRVNETTTIK